ncbi:hypothetical protein [Campylobacter sp. RM16190]|uniref:5-methylcytosine restriction system specificity protein McrC n=1 Tax=Campylobacter sp. RM16190 TaxID=1705727 RepID=UPI0014760570|nr:hypothetical protein [Campylobacter sp. RM16190]
MYQDNSYYKPDESCLKKSLGDKNLLIPSDLIKARSDVIYLNSPTDKFQSKAGDKGEENYILKKSDEGFLTGNYIGEFVYNAQEIKIGSRYGNVLLKEMLTSVSSSLFQNIEISSSRSNLKECSGSNINIEQILYIAFIKYLKRAKLNGFPKIYEKVARRNSSFSGSLDIKKLIKKDLPFTGKISSKKSGQVSEGLVGDVLLKAYGIVIKKYPKFLYMDMSLNKFLLSNSSGNPIEIKDINRTLNSKSLLNPMYQNYKTALKLAKNIILKDKFSTLGEGNNETKSSVKNLNFGYLLYVPELFENYVEKLIKETLSEIKDEKFKLQTQKISECGKYRADFIVYQKETDKIVLDAKYRHFYNGYLDNEDCQNLNQIKRYMRTYKTNIGVLIYAISNLKNLIRPNNNKKTIFILNILDDNLEIDDRFKENLKHIINQHKKEKL